jgi:LAO/AO transport system kinase
MDLATRFLAGEERALSRAITLVEAGDVAGADLLRRVRREAGGRRTHVIGVTGAPGSGKSTLVDRLVERSRSAGRRVAVVAIDPSSPFTGGAILGDRIRMTRWHGDDGVFIRSMAARGHLGGLAAATLQVIATMTAFGFDDVLVETVGVGQGEVEIVGVADSTLVVLTPGQGDGVQAVKAGVMEIADVFVVNKADQAGASRLVRDVRAMLDLAPVGRGWIPPVVETVASDGRGIDALDDALAAHLAALDERGQAAKRRQRVRHELAALVAGALQRTVAALPDGELDALSSGDAAPEGIAARLARSAASDLDSRGRTPPVAQPADGAPSNDAAA